MQFFEYSFGFQPVAILIDVGFVFDVECMDHWADGLFGFCDV